MSEIQINCPDCQHRFALADASVGERVECTACQHGFELTSEHLAHDEPQKYFPGEKAHNLGAFKRTTAEPMAEVAVDFQPADYAQAADPGQNLPTGAKHLMCIFGGMLGMAVVLCLFVLGSGPGGMLTDVPLQKRWFLVGFTALIGGLLMQYGFVKYRVAGMILTGLFVVALLAMPLIYPVHLSPVASEYDPSAVDLEVHIDPPEDSEFFYKSELGYASVESQIRKAEQPERVIAFALIGAKPVHMDTIKRYLGQSLLTAESPRVHRGRRIEGKPATLVVFLNARVSLEDAEAYAQKFADRVELREDLQLIEVEVDTDALTLSNAKELTDDTHLRFHEANLEELRSIDSKRQLAAVKRLGNTKVIRARSDIVRQLLILLTQKNTENGSAIVDTLRVWSVPEDGVCEVIKQLADASMQEGVEIPKAYLQFLIEQNAQDIGEILVYAWKRDVILQEKLIVSAGMRAESALVEVLPRLNQKQLESASHILRQVGTEESLPALEQAKERVGGDLQKTVQLAIDTIEARQ